MPTPSLILVPARFKTGKLYTPVATTSGGVVLGASGDFNVTRATTATRVNASGLIEVVASGIPRLDYFASGGVVGCPALLVEPSAQNLAWHSHLWISANNWTNTQATVVTGTSGTTDPFGTNLANAISPTAVSGGHTFFSNFPSNQVSYTSGTIYTQSAFFKQGTGDAGRYVQLTFVSSRFAQLAYVNFDLQAGQVVASGGTADANRAASIENYGNGWYRCRFTATCTSGSTGLGFLANLITASGDTRSPSFTGVTGDVLYGFGAQLETGSVATSYIPTTTAAVTRNADVINLSGAVSGCIGQTEGTIYAEVDVRNWVNNSRIFSISDGTQTNRIMTLFNSSNRFRVIVDAVSGSAQVDISSSSLTNGVHKIAVGYAANDVVFYVNGVLVGSDTTVNIPACSQAFLGKIETSASSNFLNDRIRAAALYNTRLTNAELAALTTL